MALKLGQIACNPECECGECHVFSGAATDPFPSHAPENLQGTNTGNSGSLAGTCCSEFDDLFSITEYDTNLTSPGFNGVVFPFDASLISCKVYALGVISCTSTGYISVDRTASIVFAKRSDTGDVWLGVYLEIHGTGIPPVIDFIAYRYGAVNLGAGPIDPTAGPWVVDLADANSDGDSTVPGVTCWTTPGEYSVEQVP